MRILLLAFFVFFLSGCKKDIADLRSSIDSEVVSSDALLPLKYHAVSFVTNYPVVKGKVPPFTFIKTQYADRRIKTLYMVSRYDANISTSTNQYYVSNYTFTYSTNAARAKGTRKLYKATKGALIRTFYDDLSFTFNSARICTKITAVGKPEPLYTLLSDLSSVFVFNTSSYGFVGYKDAKGNVKYFEGAWLSGFANSVSYTYDLLTLPKGMLLYQPTQYALDHWFSLLEVMQWAPGRPRNPRKSVSVSIVKKIHMDNQGNVIYGPDGNPIIERVYQSQKYLNHKYDVNGNLISYSYGDGVLQKTIWK